MIEEDFEENQNHKNKVNTQMTKVACLGFYSGQKGNKKKTNACNTSLKATLPRTRKYNELKPIAMKAVIEGYPESAWSRSITQSGVP